MHPRLPLLAALAAALLAACAAAPRTHVVPEPVVVAPAAPAARPAPRPHPACADCGRVERIEVVAAVRATATGGAVLGGVVGGVVSAPTGKTAAVASPKTPQRAWRVHVRMDDGRKLAVHQNLLAREISTGSRVRLVQGRLVPVH